jgi:hypothetical protein
MEDRPDILKSTMNMFGERVVVWSMVLLMTSGSVGADVLEFRDGEVWRGTLLGMEAGGVRWQHKASREPIAVIPQQVGVIRLQRAAAATLPRSNCRLILANGDEIAGTFAGLDEREAKVLSNFAGSLTVPRTALRALVLSGERKMLFENPPGLEGWTITDQQGKPSRTVWVFRDGAFVARSCGFLGREVQLPPVACIEFDLELTERSVLIVQFYADDLHRFYGSHSLGLEFNMPAKIVLLRQTDGPNSAMADLMQELTPWLFAASKGNPVHVAIRTDRVNKTVALHGNGRLIKKWKVTRGSFAGGSGLVFGQQQDYIGISRLQLFEQAGPEEPTVAELNATATSDGAVLQNGDRLSGRVGAVRAGVLNFQMAERELQLPVERLHWLHYAAPPPPAAPTNAVQLVSHRYGRLTLEVERWSAQQIRGRHPLLGALQLDASAFDAVEFPHATTRP